MKRREVEQSGPEPKRMAANPTADHDYDSQPSLFTTILQSDGAIGFHHNAVSFPDTSARTSSPPDDTLPDWNAQYVDPDPSWQNGYSYRSLTLPQADSYSRQHEARSDGFVAQTSSQLVCYGMAGTKLCIGSLQL